MNQDERVIAAGAPLWDRAGMKAILNAAEIVGGSAYRAAAELTNEGGEIGMAKDRDAARRNTRMRFEQWAHNPACAANTLSAVHNVRMDKVAVALGLPVTFGQSPFALARGNQFEAALLKDGAARLLPEL